MFGGSSIRIGRVFGIPIGVHPSWFVALFLFIWLLSGYYRDALPGPGTAGPFLLAVASALLFFISVVLHELGHALVARRNRIAIAGIDLWLFGGVARMSTDTTSPGVEFRVAIAGPLVTVLITLTCGVVGILASGSTAFFDAMRLQPAALASGGLALLAYLTTINLAVLIFNLVPAFPLDGGRIARSVAWWRTGDRTRATNFAARLGRAFSFVLIGLGLFQLVQGDVVGGVWLAFLGFMLGQAAQGARLQTAVTSRIAGMTVADVMEREPVVVPADVSVERAREEYFLRYRHPWFPVVDAWGRYLGVVSLPEIERVPPERRPHQQVQETIDADAGSALRVPETEALDAVLGREELGRIGALMAVDAAGQLIGVLTVEHLRRALQGG